MILGSSLHPSKGRTIRAVADRFYWPGLVTDVGRFWDGCEECAWPTRRKPNHHGLLQPIRTSAPFEILALDIFGPVPATRRGNKYVVVFIDHFSKWVELAPAKEITTKEIAKLLQDLIIPRHGCPTSLSNSQQGDDQHYQSEEADQSDEYDGACMQQG
eukprot:GHVN01080414.1.p1 GENE.GHVN01080414.1~~GHVN01080414.1.p1  ORF type:complete len:158 (+),score=1.19 GHVN01080414.1:495-968(+)